MSNTQVVVLGFHRSGTSMVAGCLHKLGVYMGDDLVLGEMPQNRKGYYEDRDFIDLNERVLSANKSDWFDPPEKLNVGDGLREEAKSLIKKKDREFWGWKDCRTCLTLPIYLKHLSNPRFVVCKREKGASVASLYHRERGKFAPAELSELYDHYQSCIINYVPQFWIVYYEDFIANLDIEHLAHYIGIKPSEEQLEASKAHIDDKLNRHRANEYRSFIRPGHR